jgi:hypothetical protein
MKTNLKFFLLLALAVISVNSFSQNNKNPKIQVALLLDTSNSMDGLIDQAKTELWSVVNELALAKTAGEQAILEIALYEYGNDNLTSENGFIRKVLDLTTDLDKISEALFALKTNGGYEYCGHVIDKASKELKWSTSDKDLKLIFIAGNEEFTQGNVDYKISCKDAISKGIIVNTIFCGNNDEGINTFWKDGADIADGKYLNIDQNQVVAYISTPFDTQISDLNSKLNQTYVAYGEIGNDMKTRQETQDENARGQSSYTSVNRTISKSSGVYVNSSWDLVDATDKGKKISDIKDDELPEEMKKMNDSEKEVYLKEKKEDRVKIQNEISDLNKKRLEYIEEQNKLNSESNTLGVAMINVVHEQAVKVGFTFPKK